MFEKEAEEYSKENCAIQKNGLCIFVDSERTSKIWRDGAEFGYAHGLKAKVNMTTISDAPLENEKRLTKAKEIIYDFWDSCKGNGTTCVNTGTRFINFLELVKEAEQFLKQEKLLGV